MRNAHDDTSPEATSLQTAEGSGQELGVSDVGEPLHWSDLLLAVVRYCEVVAEEQGDKRWRRLWQ
jgi:hypothetical protein